MEYVVAQEVHQDGSPHLHAFIKTEKKIMLSPRQFDLPDHHGNYQVAKSWKAVQKYVTKGGTFIANIDVESAASKKGKRNQVLMAMDPRDAVDQGFIDAL